MSPGLSPRPTPAESADRPANRGFWPMRDLPTLVWLLLAVVAALVHRSLPAPRWLMIHLLLLGAVTHAILVWSQYFSFALLRSRATGGERRTQNLRLILSNLGAVLVCLGVPLRFWILTATGAALLISAVAWHGASLLRRLRRSLPGRFGRTINYYIAASALLIVGAALGALVARGGAGGLALSHAIVNVLGWIGLTVAGTVVTLWPTILRTRADERSSALAERALPLLGGGVLIAAVGAALGLLPVLSLGFTCYLVGLVVIGLSLWRAARRVAPRSFPALSVGAGLGWWAGIIAVLCGSSIVEAVATRDFESVSRLIHEVVPYLAAGFAAQVLIGALSYLVPVVLGGGPGPVRVGTAMLDRIGPLRVTVTNASLLVCALPVSSVMRVVASILALVAIAAFLPLLLLAMRAQRRAKRATSPIDQRGTASVEQPPAGRRAGQGVAGLLTVVLAVAASAAIAPPPLAADAAPSGAPDAAVQTVQVAAADMRLTPDRIEVPVGTRLIIELTNTDAESPHDLVFENGVEGQRLAPGESEIIDVGVITRDLDAWCSIIGHRQMGMTLQVIAVGDRTESDTGESGAGHAAAPHHHGSSGSGPGGPLDLMSDPGSGFRPVEAALPQLPPPDGPVTHRITLTVGNTARAVAPGVTQNLWTYNGTAPGPLLHGRVGDTFAVTLVNDTDMGHSIDFHAGSLAPDEPMRTIAPGESLEYTFTATRSGIWMYHCSTMPMAAHIANGMYGAVVIEPEDLPAVDRSYVLVQSEYYLGEHDGGEVDVDKVEAGSPDLVVFNGYANQYDHVPLTARVGERVRFWVLDAGIERPTSFHVVGGQFDTVWSEGGYVIDHAERTGSQALGLLPAQGGFVELALPEPGDYPFVSHLMTDAERGAHGILRVTP